MYLPRQSKTRSGFTQPCFWKQDKNRAGFSLVELLVVASIISLLASVALSGLNNARNKAFDVKRKADLVSLEKALELYFQDNKSYPLTGAGIWYSSEPGDAVGNNGGNYIPGLAPNYIQTLPRDPVGGPSTIAYCIPGGWKKAYLYRSDGSSYELLALCGPSNYFTAPNPAITKFYDPLRATRAYKVCQGSTLNEACQIAP